jgi:hypothetical protein
MLPARAGPHPTTPAPARPGRPWLRWLGIVAAVAAAAACSRVVTVPTDFPEPLVAALPLRVGVYYPPEFRDYVHKDEGSGDTTWEVRIGAANVAVFDRVFARLFRSATRVDAIPAAGTGSGFDAWLEPRVEAFELALPAQSGTNQYSVWIRYSLRVYGPDGTLVTTWPVSAYGQSGSAMLRGSQSLETAAVLAMRDAAAMISVGFAKQSAIRKALLAETPATKEESGNDPS